MVLWRWENKRIVSPLISDYLQCFRQGEVDSAFFGLLNIGSKAIPELICQFQQERDNAIREFLVEVIWQYRQASAIPFLAERLYDPAPAIRRQALNGLVTLASPQVLEVLTAAKAHWRLQAKDTEAFADWLDEAIGQVESTQDNISIK